MQMMKVCLGMELQYEKEILSFYHEAAFAVFPGSEAQNRSLAALKDMGRRTSRRIIREAEEYTLFLQW